jgi:hypothetical protein
MEFIHSESFLVEIDGTEANQSRAHINAVAERIWKMKNKVPDETMKMTGQENTHQCDVGASYSSLQNM